MSRGTNLWELARYLNALLNVCYVTYNITSPSGKKVLVKEITEEQEKLTKEKIKKLIKPKPLPVKEIVEEEEEEDDEDYIPAWMQE